MKQQTLRFRTWGGKRKGAGRRPTRGTAGVSHLPRPGLARRFPVHVTLRMRPHVWNLRSRRAFRPLERCFLLGGDRFGFRLIHYSVQGNHIHLLCEAQDRKALSRGMQGLSIRVAKALNRLMGTKGGVLNDRYHARILRTPTEVRRVREYLSRNAAKHYALVGDDPFASRVPVIEPETWLLRRHC